MIVAGEIFVLAHPLNPCGPKEMQPLDLSPEEKEQIKDFLKALTGEPVPLQFLRGLHNP